MKKNNKPGASDNASRHLTMKELPGRELPYEKCRLKGSGALSTEELLAVLLRFGTREKRVTEIARDVLSKCEEYGGLAFVDRIPPDELMAIEGIGKVRFIQLLCLGELARRMSADGKKHVFAKVNSPADVCNLFSDELRSLEVEETWALYLDGKNNVIKKCRLTRGTVNGSVISGRELYKEAVRSSAAGVILVHNHPSADPEPSSDDIEITRILHSASKLVDIELIDHVIIGDRSFVSLRERGILK